MKTLTEVARRKTAVFSFGRMNPPTSGHEKLINKVLEVASKNSATPFIFVSQTQDSKKNPLTSAQKIKYLKLGIPASEKYVVNKSNIKNPFDALGYIKDQGYTDVILVVGSDRVEKMRDQLGKYATYHPDPKKSFGLLSFTVVSAGDRDPEEDGISGMSASKMRDAAARNDFASFKEGVPSKLSIKFAKEMFAAIRSAMSIKEVVESIQRISSSLDIPRIRMPQIRRDDLPEFIKSLEQKGISVSQRHIKVDTLLPTQNEVNMDKIKDKYEKFSNGKSPKPFVVSYDNYILDGHHQLYALKTLDKHTEVPCFVVALKMKDLLKMAHNFPKTHYKQIDD